MGHLIETLKKSSDGYTTKSLSLELGEDSKLKGYFKLNTLRVHQVSRHYMNTV